jgi:hypothetical protein
VEIDRGVEAGKKLEKISMIHVIQHIILPSNYNHGNGSSSSTPTISLESQALLAVSKVAGSLSISPEVYFSRRYLPRQAFPSLFQKQEDGTLAIKESKLFDHFNTKTNVYHTYPSDLVLKDTQRSLKIHIFDSQLLPLGANKMLKIIND